ncbi:MAG: GNAT family N-acetyltransferase [bacterium]
MIIRPEKPSDTAGIRYLNEEAFGRPLEARLVDTLRSRGRIMLSLVAVRDDHVVGHISFSPVTVETEKETLTVAGLAPMAIAPTLQRQGIGSLLVKAGLDGCRKAGLAGVVVLGHPDYYPRFGFVPASNYGIRSEYAVPEGVFMAIELRAGALHAGLAKYVPEFELA